MAKAILFDMVGVLIFKKSDYVAKTQGEINADEIEQAVRLIPEKYERFEDLWKLLPELKKKYKLAVINNGNTISLKYWKEKFDFSIFDLFINSAEEGIKKPDTKIFSLTYKRLNIGPQECLFMDDNLENIEAAKDLKMQTVWWNKNLAVEKHLTKFKLLIQ